MITPTKEQQDVLDATGHLLVMGGPGSGKTTIALLKARELICSGKLLRGQRVLFLSFARATIARVEEQATSMLQDCDMSALEITTYHGFIWNILKNYGYLLIPHKTRILLPHEASTRLSGIESETERETEKRRLFYEEGLLHFDLFAEQCADLLNRSRALAKIIADAYPYIFLDEFQDTDAHQWELVQRLGQQSTIIALADPEQRIYDFRGADPARIRQYIEALAPLRYDFEAANHRSNGTDIVEFGNDLLTGDNIAKAQRYHDVHIYSYNPWSTDDGLLTIKSMVLASYKRVSVSNPNWSIAVLVTSNKTMLDVSEYFGRTTGRMPSIAHEVAIESAGPTIAAILIADLLDAISRGGCNLELLIIGLQGHILGRNGESEKTTKSDQQLAGFLANYLRTRKEPGKNCKNQKQLLDECSQIIEACNAITLSGDVSADWISVRDTFKGKESKSLQNLLLDASYVKLLHKGSALSASLNEIWRDSATYKGAAEAVRAALKQEYFAATTTQPKGIHVMTIHKSKGKEFDEVIIFEGNRTGRFLHGENYDQTRLNLRVAVTRAKKHADILVAKQNPCPLLLPLSI